MKIKHLFIGIALTANLFAATAQEVKKTYFVSKPGTLISMMTEDEANQVHPPDPDRKDQCSGLQTSAANDLKTYKCST